MGVEYTRLATDLRDKGCTVLEREPMSLHTSFKIGGPADLLVTAPDEEAAAAVFALCGERRIPVMLAGNGTNLLVSDHGIEGVVLRLESGGEPVLAPDGRTVTCCAGYSVKRLCLFARDHGLAGLEFAYGIPGTVGGGVFMNAGAYGGQMADVLVSVRAMDRRGRIRQIPAEALDLGYRHSGLMETGEAVLSAVFRLEPDDKAAVSGRMEDFMARRKEKQPLEYPSAGSFFKRPPGYFAGTLIEQTGLKGFTVGGAQISEKHAGFVINKGGATCGDVLELSRQVRQRVFDRHGVRLEPEVRPVGRDIE